MPRDGVPPRQSRICAAFRSPVRSQLEAAAADTTATTFGPAQRRRGRQGSGSAEGGECVCRRQCNRRNCDERPCLGRSGSGSSESRGCNSSLYQWRSALGSDAANIVVRSLTGQRCFMMSFTYFEVAAAASCWRIPHRSLSKRASLLARLGGRAERLFRHRADWGVPRRPLKRRGPFASVRVGSLLPSGCPASFEWWIANENDVAHSCEQNPIFLPASAFPHSQHIRGTGSSLNPPRRRICR